MKDSVIFLNGDLVPECQAVVSVFDRGFLYGDGLFEAIRICQGNPFRWTQHWHRLAEGAALLKIRTPFSASDLRQGAAQLVEQTGRREAMLRIVLTRGPGPRGYSPAACHSPTVVMTLHELPAAATAPELAWRLATASVRVAESHPLTRLKTCNRLPQILARAEADAAGVEEALLLNSHGRVTEGSSSNLFAVEREAVLTPSLEEGALDGVTRATVLELCQAAGIASQECPLTLETLRAAEGVFMTSSSVGVIPVDTLDGHLLQRSQLTEMLRTQYEALLRRETAAWS